MNTDTNEWLLDDAIIHLNHAAVAPWPARTRTAIEDFVNQNLHIGSKHYLEWVKRETLLRQQLKELINAPSSDDIALLKNTSEGLSVVAYGLPWKKGDNVVISDQEFPSNRIVWESLQERFGVDVRTAHLDQETPEEALIAQCNEDTKLLSISSVQYASGLKLDLRRIGEFCSENQILLCVDAIQSLGALTFDVQEIKADFVVADAHKWMLGPEGIALFYCRKDSRDKLQLNQFGWHMVEHAGDFDRKEWMPADSARRFECGSPNMLGIFAFSASLSLLLKTGISTVEKRILERTVLIHEFIEECSSLEAISTQKRESMSGIVTFRHRTEELDKVYERLQSHGVLCALRGGGIRFSPHYYTPVNKIKTALELAAN